MKQKQLQKLQQLFNGFAEEEQASSFAVNNLFNRAVQIIMDNQKQANPNKVDKDAKKDN